MNEISSGFRLHADLKCEFDGFIFSIISSDDLIVVDVPDLRTAFRLLRLRFPGSGLSERLQRLSDSLGVVHSNLELHVDGVCIAALRGGHEKPFNKRFRGLVVRPTALIRSALQRKKK